MTIEQLLGRLLPILPVVWVALSPTMVRAQEQPIVMAPGQFGYRPSVFTGYGPGFGYAPGIGYGYGFSPRFTPVYDPRYLYGPRVTWGFGLGYFSPLGLGPQYAYGPSFGYLGRSYGYGFGWYYPAAFGSFWTNGLSLYGPPVPTFAITPGSFGGSDAHRTYFLQSYYSLDWDAFRYKSTMPYGWEPTAKFASPYRICTPAVAVRVAPSSNDRARIAIRVPHPDAELWVGTTKMKPGGFDRVFESPALEAGTKVEYEFIVRWIDRGESKAESRTLTVKPGDSLEIDFITAKD